MSENITLDTTITEYDFEVDPLGLRGAIHRIMSSTDSADFGESVRTIIRPDLPVFLLYAAKFAYGQHDGSLDEEEGMEVWKNLRALEYVFDNSPEQLRHLFATYLSLMKVQELRNRRIHTFDNVYDKNLASGMIDFGVDIASLIAYTEWSIDPEGETRIISVPGLISIWCDNGEIVADYTIPDHEHEVRTIRKRAPMDNLPNKSQDSVLSSKVISDSPSIEEEEDVLASEQDTDEVENGDDHPYSAERMRVSLAAKNSDKNRNRLTADEGEEHLNIVFDLLRNICREIFARRDLGDSVDDPFEEEFSRILSVAAEECSRDDISDMLNAFSTALDSGNDSPTHTKEYSFRFTP